MKKLILGFVLLLALQSAPAFSQIANLGLGANFVGGGGAFCLNGGLSFNPTIYENVYFGGDVTFDFFSSPTIELLPTVWYRFHIPRHAYLHPILGFLLGPAINFSSGVSLEAGIRFAFEYAIKSTWGIKLEVQGGVLSSSFFFKPLVNITYYL